MMIPPPYPFPGKWPAQFQQQATRWPTPYTQILPRHVVVGPLPFPSQPPALLFPQPPHPTQVPMYPPPHVDSLRQMQAPLAVGECDPGVDSGSIGDEESDDDEYEYAYVLNDTWQQYLKDNVLSDDESGERDANAPARHHPQQHPQRQQRGKKSAVDEPKRTRGGKKHQPTVSSRMSTQLELALDTARELERQRRQQRLLPSTTMAEDMTSAAREEASSRERHMAISAATAFTGHDPKCERVGGHPSGEDERHSSLQVVEQLEAELHLGFEAFCDNNSPAVWPQGAS